MTDLRPLSVFCDVELCSIYVIRKGVGDLARRVDGAFSFVAGSHGVDVPRRDGLNQ
jgi:hypothetical protein